MVYLVSDNNKKAWIVEAKADTHAIDIVRLFLMKRFFQRYHVPELALSKEIADEIEKKNESLKEDFYSVKKRLKTLTAKELRSDVIGQHILESVMLY